MKLFTKLTILAGICVLLASSCMIGSIADRIAEASNGGDVGSGDAILITKNTYPVSSIQDLKVSTSGGSIDVAGDASQEAVIEMYVKPNNNRNLSQGEIQEILDRDYEIRIEQRGGTLEAYAKRRNNLNWRNGLSVSFKVRTGNKVTTDLSTSGGSIRLANLAGRQNFKTSGGSLDIENMDGNITGRTSGGSIQAYNSMGTINLSTSGGSIKMQGLNGDIDVSTSGGSIEGHSVNGSLTARTSGGSIDLESLTCSVNASTSGGSLTAVLNELPGDVRLSTSAGNVNLTLPSNTGANLDLKGFNVNVDGLANFQGSNNKGKLNGSINGGGANVQASTSAGNVNLTIR
ncbi:DUF4097 family beta strand repeat-containing protein [Albibacterium bauzanense]|uniref:DUF4097 domain-containing protein n=1 Tax=Albibacterium bauzanense TaxID=653929 RepID=A0A4R1M1I6_9SPHI|nr:DUF4097 family beta strand repeat-containing protein [Albibacterium bauzanense]TCK84714.1 hypothetical protein C8N28_0006 [Albibacterium bauzanense]